MLRAQDTEYVGHSLESSEERERKELFLPAALAVGTTTAVYSVVCVLSTLAWVAAVVAGPTGRCSARLPPPKPRSPEVP